MSFVFAEKYYDDDLKQERFYMSCDTKIITVSYSKANFSSVQYEMVNKWGIVKMCICSSDFCVAFAGNNIKYAAELFLTLKEKSPFNLCDVSSFAFDIHKRAENTNDIEFIVAYYENDKLHIDKIANNEIIKDCVSAWIGSYTAFRYFQEQRLAYDEKNIHKYSKTVFDKTVSGCGDDSVGGFPIELTYNLETNCFEYLESASFYSFKNVAVNSGEIIPFFTSPQDGGFSMRTQGCGIDSMLVSFDQIDRHVLFSRRIRIDDIDALNPNLFGLMLPVEIYYEDGEWKRLK